MRRPEPFPPNSTLVVIHQPEYEGTPESIWHAFPVGTVVISGEYAEDDRYRTITCRPLGARSITQQIRPSYLALPNSPAAKRAHAQREEERNA